ncbi:MAG TPA: NUDIX hydrolase [Polyangiaceae bacterium]|jgi:ADP-ribose pyrophosphatase|nr:NUDIX hydrolase [Polyangiaceae bacterium]
MPARGAPSFPKLKLELLEALPPGEPGFLRLIRRKYRLHYPDGTHSDPFSYDVIDRTAIDAVVIVAHFADESGARRVFLRSAFRPPITLRDPARSPLPDETADGALWELPAGLIEPKEQSPEGAVRAAQRELFEELGFEVPLSMLRALGPSAFPVPGFIAERQFFFEVSVNPSTRVEPALDGSALERFGVVVDVPLAEALEWCRSGVIEDSKTELALRRLEERYR